nr:hypothetical protein [Tanacetum cinerariifolium]
LDFSSDFIQGGVHGQAVLNPKGFLQYNNVLVFHRTLHSRCYFHSPARSFWPSPLHASFASAVSLPHRALQLYRLSVPPALQQTSGRIELVTCRSSGSFVRRML